MKALLFALSWSLCTALILSYNEKNTYYFSPFLPEEGLQVFNVTAPTLALDNIFEARWDSGEANGTIGVMMSDDVSGKFREDYAFRAMEIGMVGLVGWTSWEPDHFAEFYDPASLVHINIPYVTVRLSDREEMRSVLFDPNIDTYMTLISSDSPNEWPVVFTSVWYTVIWRGLLAAYAVILAFVCLHALFRWYLYWREAKTYSRIAVLCLIVEFLCCAERGAFHMLGGLLGCRSLPYPAIRLMYTATLPLNYLTTALTAAYLHEVLTTKSPLGTMVQKTKKPLCCLSVYYLLTDWPMSLIASFSLFFGSGVLAIIASGLLTAGTGITALMLLYITVRLGKYYKKKTPKKTERPSIGAKGDKEQAPPDRLKELVSRVQICAFWLLWTTLGFVFTLLPQFHEPLGFAVINIWIFIGLNTTSLMHILAYGKTPKLLKRSTSSVSDRRSIDVSTQPSRGKPKMPGLAVVVPAESPAGSKAGPESPSPADLESDNDHSVRNANLSMSEQDPGAIELSNPRERLTEGYDELDG